MFSDDSMAYRPTRKAHHIWRWSLLITLSVLLHIIAISWTSGNLRMPAMQTQPDPVLATILPPLAPIAASPQTPAKRPSAVQHPPQKHIAKAHRVLPAKHEDAPTQSVPDTTNAVSNAITDANTNTVNDTANASNEANAADKNSPADKAPSVTQNSADKHYVFKAPPSVELKYDVTKVPRDGQPMYGHGSIHWQLSNDKYQIDGDAGVLFITVLTFRSEGTIDEFGVAPLLYSEKGFHKSETNTHFQRERNTISFSASTVSYPRKGGEQDRASIIWQLASIGRGNPDQITAGMDIPIFVAGVRDGEVWNIHVLGQEEIDTGLGKMTTWHMIRLPKPGSYDKTIDIWLAPQHEWYPVKLRYTEKSGDYLDLSLTDMGTDSPQ
jgi:hypothetical protein